MQWTISCFDPDTTNVINLTCFQIRQILSVTNMNPDHKLLVSRGLFITIHDRGHIATMLNSWPEEDIKVCLFLFLLVPDETIKHHYWASYVFVSV